MKASILSLLPVLASAAVLDTRQIGKGGKGGKGLGGLGGLGGLLGGLGKELKVAWVRDLKPDVRKDAIRQLVGFGPVELKAGKKDAQQSFIFSIKNGFCKGACTVLKGKAGIEIKGQDPEAEDKLVYIHHILTNDMTKPMVPFLSGCTNAASYSAVSGGKSGSGGITGIGQKFIGTGDDQAGIYAWYTSRDGKLDAGFQIGENDVFMQNVDLVSMSNDRQEVFITMELEYLKGNVGAHTRDILLSSGPCNGIGGIKLSETGPTNTTSGKYYFHEDGVIVYAKAHLHAGGEAMHMYINDKHVCTSKATYGQGDKGPITAVEICPKEIAVKKGDYLSMVGSYDASKHQIRHDHGMGGMADVMAMWAFSFAAKK